ncbi:MAG: tetratricopeptide repeat protein [Deltaproteobacteria bacterium]|nr:tetratricopeptide repeat protein [Deltaproteobacteria bacterium]
MAKKKHKDEIEELKAPDQFVSFWTRVGERLSRHRRGLVTIVVTVLAATAALQVGRYVFSKRDGETSRAFAKIEQIATAGLIPAEGEPPKFDDGVAHFKTDEERKQAALKEAETFLAAHSKGKLAAMAKLLKASFLRDLGKNDEAIALYQPLTSSDDLSAELQLVALDGLALAQEAAGQIDAALATLDKLHTAAKAQQGFLGDRALYTKARLLESKGKAEEAKALYKSISADYPNTTLREEVTRRLALLDEATSGAATP